MITRGPFQMDELISREIFGCGGIVTLYADGEYTKFVVTVRDHTASTVANIECETREQALTAFKHPFSFNTTPDVFK